MIHQPNSISLQKLILVGCLLRDGRSGNHNSWLIAPTEICIFHRETSHGLMHTETISETDILATCFHARRISARAFSMKSTLQGACDLKS